MLYIRQYLTLEQYFGLQNNLFNKSILEMPRANRYYIPGYVWHITHQCHKKEFLLKFVRDRRRWIGWLFEAKKRYGIRNGDEITSPTYLKNCLYLRVSFEKEMFIQNSGIVFIKISKNAKNRDFAANLSCIASDRIQCLIFFESSF